MLRSTMSVLLMAALVGLASSTCSVTSSDEKAEANDPANYQVTKLMRGRKKYQERFLLANLYCSS